MFTYCVVSCQFPFHFTISPLSFHFSHCIASFCILYFTAGMYYFIFFVDFIFLTNTYNFPSSLLCCFISLSFHCCAVPLPFHFTIVLSLFLPFYQHVILFLLFHCCVAPFVFTFFRLITILFFCHFAITISHFTPFYHPSIISYHQLLLFHHHIIICCFHHLSSSSSFTLHSLSSSLFCYPSSSFCIHYLL